MAEGFSVYAGVLMLQPCLLCMKTLDKLLPVFTLFVFSTCLLLFGKQDTVAILTCAETSVLAE